jgi:hypothetical protein
MDVSMARAALVLALTLLTYSGGAAAAGVTPYFETSGSQKPRGDAGLSVARDKLQLNANVALRSGDRTQVIPRVSSAFALSERLGVVTELNLAEWNGRSDLIDRTFDTRLHFRSPAPFLEALEGRFWRSPDGRSGRILKFGFYQTVRDSTFAIPLTVRGSATVEALSGGVANAGMHGNRKMRIETEVAGLPAGTGARKALRMKVERQEGSRPHATRSIAYDHAWTVGASSRLGLNVEMREASSAPTLGFAPSFGLSWRSELR